jgi:hypothetical protein
VSLTDIKQPEDPTDFLFSAGARPGPAFGFCFLLRHPLRRYGKPLINWNNKSMARGMLCIENTPTVGRNYHIKFQTNMNSSTTKINQRASWLRQSRLALRRAVILTLLAISTLALGLQASDVDGFTNRLNNNLAKPGVKVRAQAYAIPTQAEAKAR